MGEPTSESNQVTELLHRWSDGGEEALDELMPIVYGELRKLARRYLRKERPDHTLQPTGLVHEAYLRLVGQREVRWQGRAHFYGIASQLMRRILVDHARRRRAAKRGGGETLVAFEEEKGSPQKPAELIALDEALTAFTEVDGRAARLVELRQFGGLSLQEASDILGVSEATAKRDWLAAKAWLSRELKRGGAG